MQKLPLCLYFSMLCLLASAQTIQNVNTWAFQLQNFNVNSIGANSNFDLIVTDYSHDGSEAMKLTSAEVTTVKNSGKLLVSYISIGEAEDYRTYWQQGWSSTPPAWLGPENPNWQGNYKVKYWDPAWQNIVFNYVDTIMAQGFNGIYLDIIDAWYYWQQEVPVGQRVANADSLMMDFVLRIRNHVTAAGGSQSFVIIPQNGEDLIFQSAISPAYRTQYLNAINAVGIEDVFFTGSSDIDNPYAPDYYRLNNLLQYKAAGKKILTIEYLTQPVKIIQYKDTAAQYGFVAYACTRPLDELCDAITLGIDQNTNADFSLSPNPLTGSTITLQSEQLQNSTICLTDITGRQITTFQVLKDGIGTIEIPGSLSNGLYFIAIIKGGNTYVQRLIVNR